MTHLFTCMLHSKLTHTSVTRLEVISIYIVLLLQKAFCHYSVRALEPSVIMQ